jgi:glycosyltransferase involved in cell wall biosynthesis
MRIEIPLVSVLMTAYNREKYIAAAIESVLLSTLKDFELIIVDDGSVDDTVAIAKGYARKDSRIVVYLNENNLGDYPNRNKAASYAKGKYLKYLDSDDIMYRHCLDVMVSCMEKFPDAGYGLSAFGDSQNPYPVCLTPREAYLENFMENKAHFGRAPGSSIIKREAFNRVKGFSGIRQVGDFEFWMKIGCYYPMVKMPVDLYWSRLHESSESKFNTTVEKDELRMKVIRNIFATETVPLENELKEKIILNSSAGSLRRWLKKLQGKLMPH